MHQANRKGRGLVPPARFRRTLVHPNLRIVGLRVKDHSHHQEVLPSVQERLGEWFVILDYERKERPSFNCSSSVSVGIERECTNWAIHGAGKWLQRRVSKLEDIPIQFERALCFVFPIYCYAGSRIRAMESVSSQSCNKWPKDASNSVDRDGWNFTCKPSIPFFFSISFR